MKTVGHECRDLVSCFSGGDWRCVVISPGADEVAVALADHARRFLFRMKHENQRITHILARPERFPWSTCRDVCGFLAEQLVGRRRLAIAVLNPLSHCTRLFGLAIL